VSSDYSVIFGHNESLVFNVLWMARNSGRVVTKEIIFDALYSLDPNGGPGRKIIDVLLCRIRQRLARAAADVEIVTVFRSGYFLRGKGRKLPARIVSRSIRTA
jgi:DNA-binding response OmpR family regulator